MRVLSPLTVLCLTGCLTSYDQGYQDAVRDFGADASSMQDTIDDLTARLEALEGASGGNAASVEDLDALATRVTAIEADYASDTEVAAVATDVTDLETLVTSTYATTAYVDSVAAGTVDLTTYVQRTELSDYATLVDLSNYAPTSSLQAYALSTDLANYALSTDLDAYALDTDLASYALSSELDAYALDTDLDAYALSTDLDAYALSTDLDAYALITDLDTVVADLGTLDANTPDFIGADLTINVDAAGNGDFTDIPSALDSIANSFIAANAVVTIQVADGTYAMADSIVFYHPQGRNIYLRGNPTQPELVVLEWSTQLNGIVVAHDATLGEINGFTLRGAGQNVGGGSAIELTEGGSLFCGRFETCALRTEEWGAAGIFASDGALAVVAGLQASAANHGIWVRPGAFVRATSSGFRNNTTSGVVIEGGGAFLENSTMENNSTGVNVINGGYAFAIGVTSSANSGGGFRADRGSFIRADNSSSLDNGSSGFFASSNATINVSGADATGNGQWGYGMNTSAHIFGSSTTTASGNASGDFLSPNVLTADGAYLYAPGQ